MTTTRSTFQTVLIAVMLIAGVQTLAACSSGSPEQTTASSDPQVRTHALHECLRGKGYEVEDPTGEQVGFSIPKGADPTQYSDDVIACGKEVDGEDGASGAGAVAKPLPGLEEAELQSAQCIRDGGFPDYPDDMDSKAAYHPADQAEFSKVAERCSKEAFGSISTESAQ